MSPEKCGGGGADLSTAAIVADLLGAYVAPIPFIEHVVARVLASLDASNPDLTQLAAGEMIASLDLQSLNVSQTAVIPAGAVANRILALGETR